MLSPDELLRLATEYGKATKLSLSTVGRLACGNDKIFMRLAHGHGASSRSIAQATEWFEANWPKGMRWPKGVPGGPRPTPRQRTRDAEPCGAP